LKPGVTRPYIPDAKTLAQWAEVSRLIATPLTNLKDEPMKRKWRGLQADDSQSLRTVRTTAKGRGIGRTNQVEKKTYKKRGPKPSPGKTILRRQIQKRKYTSRKPGPVKAKKIKTIVTQSTSDGYLLVPEASVKMEKGRKKVGRKKQEEDVDPEFIADSVKVENANGGANNSERRRSSRTSTRRVVPAYADDEFDIE
jgi:hypothetical protein